MNSKFLMIATAFSVLVAGSPALAQEMNKSGTTKYGNSYVRIDAGTMWVRDIDFNSAMSAHGVSTTAGGNYSFDMGFTVGGAVGYRFSKRMRAELEMNYGSADFDSINGTMTVTSGGANRNVSGSLAVSGDVTQMGGMANVIFDIGTDDKFVPYIGGGLGFFNVKSKISKIGSLAVTGEETDTYLAANMTVGGDYRLKDKVSIGGRYRYLWVNSQKEGLEDMASHALMATVTFDM